MGDSAVKVLKSAGIFLKFLHESCLEFQLTGTIFPTSKWAAKAMTDPLRNEARGNRRNILELGPGTGPVTVKILADMNDEDTLTICEINPRFMAILQTILNENSDYRRHKERVRFFCCAAQELPEDATYDVIVCSLPFLNFDLKTVRQIFNKLVKLSHEKTLMTNYEYIGLRGIGKLMSPRKRRRRIYQVDRFFRRFAPNPLKRTKVWLNVLPINIYTRKLAA